MLTVELQLVSNGRRFSVDELVELIAGKITDRVVAELKERFAQPPPEPSRHDTRKAIGINEAARMLGISRSTIWNHISEGRIRVVRLGRRTLVPMEVINAALRHGI